MKKNKLKEKMTVFYKIIFSSILSYKFFIKLFFSILIKGGYILNKDI